MEATSNDALTGWKCASISPGKIVSPEASSSRESAAATEESPGTVIDSIRPARTTIPIDGSVLNRSPSNSRPVLILKLDIPFPPSLERSEGDLQLYAIGRWLHQEANARDPNTQLRRDVL